MTKNQANNKSTLRQFMTRLLIFIAVFIVLFVVLAYDLWVGGKIQYYSKWISCGQKPVVAAALPGGGINYYKNTSPISLLRGSGDTYFCTPLEAEKAGYSANPYTYEFPYLSSQKLNTSQK